MREGNNETKLHLFYTACYFVWSFVSFSFDSYLLRYKFSHLVPVWHEVSVMLRLVTSTDVIIQHFNQTAARRRSGEQTQNFSRNCWYSELDQVENSFLFLEFQKKSGGASYYAYFIQAVSIFSIQHGYINK